MSEQIPESHRDLLAGPVNVALTTIMPDGQPQTTPIWCNLEGDYVLINSMKQFRKVKNMHLNPKVTLLAYELKHPLRNIEVRGQVVEMTEEGSDQVVIRCLLMADVLLARKTKVITS